MRAAAASLALVLVLPSTGIDVCRGTLSSESAHEDLSIAVRRTLKEPTIRSERRAVPDLGAGTMVEEFIAPHRVRASLPPSTLEGFPGVPSTQIGIGRRVYFQDTLAPPPKSELFVTCLQKRPIVPEMFGVLELVADAKDVRTVSGSEDRFRFRLDVDTKPLKKIFDGVRGEATISTGRITGFELKDTDVDGSNIVWSLSFGPISPIDAPLPDQIARRDCTFTQGTPTIIQPEGFPIPLTVAQVPPTTKP